MLLKAIYIALTAAPGAAKSYALTARKNAADTAVTVTVTGAATTTGNLTGQAVQFAPDDLLALKSIPSGTPAAGIVQGGLLFQAPAAISTLTDNFDDNSTDTAKWSSFADTHVSVAEASQEVEVTLSSATGGQYGGYDGAHFYDLTGDAAYCRVVDAGNQALEMDVLPVILQIDSSNQLQWDITDGFLYAIQIVAGSTTNVRNNVAYNSAVHKFFRIRESAGTTYWDYATIGDGSDWTNYTSAANPIPVTALQPRILAGIWGTAGSTVLKFDNFNVAGAGGGGGTAVKDILGMGILPFAR